MAAGRLVQAHPAAGRKRDASPKCTSLLDRIRGFGSALASAKYYLTWLMRLEGKTRAEWEPEIDGSRQLYRLLAEKARDVSDDELLRNARRIWKRLCDLGGSTWANCKHCRFQSMPGLLQWKLQGQRQRKRQRQNSQGSPEQIGRPRCKRRSAS